MIGVIFDMDGVIIDNTEMHIKAWQEFFKQHDLEVSEKEFKSILGMKGGDFVRAMFKRELTDAEVERYKHEKETIYMEMYKDTIEPMPGLPKFLKALQGRNIPLAIATGAPPMCVDFVLESTGLREYFPVVVDDTHAGQGKPDPSIFLEAAEAIGRDPCNCIVFEDAQLGIQAARAIDMKVVAVATTHPKGHLDADLEIHDFTEINVEKIEALFEHR